MGSKVKSGHKCKKDHQIVKYRQELLLVDSSGVRIIFLQKTNSIEVDFDKKNVKNDPYDSKDIYATGALVMFAMFDMTAKITKWQL